MQVNYNGGKVIVAGAGPGDPELITLKALRYLRLADVVIVDRLVSPELLAEVKESATVLFAGKQGGNEDSVSQDEINRLMIENARQNLLVLRLKGGDVSIFSNLLDELGTLVAHGIPYEIIPGITAASGAAAYAGIPLTARGYATAVRFLTCYKPEVIASLDWKELAATADTLVFYMSSSALDGIVGKLLDHGASADKYLAIIEQATTPQQNVELLNLYAYEFSMTSRRLSSPSLIIIGAVSHLHEKFRWTTSTGKEDYFKPLELHGRKGLSYMTH